MTGVPGSGKPKTDLRTVEEFHSIQSSGAVQVKVSLGDSQIVEVTFDDNLVDFVKTETVNGVLQISTLRHWNSKLKLIVEVTTPDLEKISTAGACELTMPGTDQEKLELVLSGASSVNVSGKIGDLKINGSGASSLDLGGLVVANASIELSGASHAIVHATEQITANTSGSSTLDILGNPAKVAASPKGASTINRK